MPLLKVLDRSYPGRNESAAREFQKEVAQNKGPPSQNEIATAGTSTKQIAKRSSDGRQKESIPQSLEAEQGILSTMLQYPRQCIAEANRKCRSWYFYSPPHRTIYETLCDFWESGATVDLITYTQFLRDKKILEQVGGAAFLTELQTMIANPAAMDWYIQIVREKAMLREIISAGTHAVRRAYGCDGDVGPILEDFGRAIDRMKYEVGGPNGSESQSMERLLGLNTGDGQNSLVGNNYLVRGGNSLWAGGAGYGKSSLTMQLAVYWATGTPVFGLRPRGRLKSLIIQAENDDYDMADQVQGVMHGIESIGDLDLDQRRGLVLENVLVYRVAAKSGYEFLAILDDLIGLTKPDLAWIDPLFAYAGCDLMNAQRTGKFLREGLFPVAGKHNCCLNVVHHIGKPVRDKNQIELSNTDKQYLGFGTSEIQNAFRAVNSLLPVKTADGRRIFSLTFSKRGIRAGAKTPDGVFTDHVFLEYSRDGICWLQCDEPEPPQKIAAQCKYDDEDILEHMSVAHGLRTAAIQKLAKEESGMRPATFYRMWKDLKSAGKIRVDQDGLWFRKGLTVKT